MNQRLGGQQPLLSQQQMKQSDVILGQNLEENGEPAPPDYVALHIIPLHDEQVRAARDVKALFDHFFPPQSYQHLPLKQWPINQAFNGVWLRRDRLHLLQPKEMPSSFMNHTDFYQTLYERLKDQPSQEAFLTELQQIKADLAQHRFWDQNPSKLAEIETYRQKKMEEQQILAHYDAEMKAYLPDDLKNELNKWPSPEEIKEVADEFSDILNRYQEAQEKQNPASFDAFLTQGLHEIDTTPFPSVPFDLRRVLEQKGLVGKQQTFSFDPEVQQQRKGSQRERFRKTLEKASRKTPRNSLRKKSDLEERMN